MKRKTNGPHAGTREVVAKMLWFLSFDEERFRSLLGAMRKVDSWDECLSTPELIAIEEIEAWLDD